MTIAILVAMRDEALAAGQTPIVVLLPDHKDVEAAMAGTSLPYQPLLDALIQRDIETPNIMEAMLGFLGEGNDVCDLFINCSEHYTPAGYNLVARVIQLWIESRGLIDSR